MKKVKKILVGLDLGSKGQHLTQGSRRALDLVLDIAPTLDAHVTLFHSSSADEHWEQDESGHVYAADGMAGWRC